MRCRQSTIRHAFTLPETLVAAAVLAFAVAAICQAVVSGQMHTYAAVSTGRSVALAEALMDEIVSLPYNDPHGDSTPGPEQGERQRSQFDNIDDYHGYTEDAGELADENASAYADPLQTYTRQVTVAPYTMNVGSFGAIEGVLVTVTITDRGDASYTLRRFVPEPPVADGVSSGGLDDVPLGPPREGDSGDAGDAESGSEGGDGPGNNGQGHAYGHDKNNRGRGRW